ncbi:universal stress protein [Fontimonas sp. SYSU GA230001]|uniref:universal stress protein n=1 Tax=Fontimonas sp. SYSU GA230001 TaxID=3142450 RepID=UPI0032B4A4D8
MTQRLVVGYDGSESAGHAFDFALDLAQKLGASLLVIAVAQPPDLAEDVETEAVLEHAETHFKASFAAMKHRAAAAKVTAHFEVVVGHPAEQLVARAEKHQAHMIVLGHRGKSLFERLMVGSVSKRVVEYAHCAVVIVR